MQARDFADPTDGAPTLDRAPSPAAPARAPAPPSLAIAEAVVGWLRPGGAEGLAEQTAAWGAGAWTEARYAALVHGVAPLLAALLGPTPAWAALDPALRAYLADQRALNGRRLALMRGDLAAILAAANSAGVAVLPLKGAVLAEHYYPEPALRPMADLDLLVRPAELPRLDAALAGLGYAAAEETPRHRAYHRGAPTVASWDGEHPDNPRGVEVHTTVGEQLRAISYEITAALWASAAPTSYGGAPGLAPAPAALLHHLLIHTCHNMVNRRLRLVQLYDLALVAPRLGPADWDALACAATRAGEARLLYAPLALAERVFGPLAPQGAREALARGTPPALRALVARVAPSELSLCDRREVSPAFRLAWYRPGAERVGALLRVALPVPAELRQRYPGVRGGLPAAYLRHAGHALAWAARAATGRARRAVKG